MGKAQLRLVNSETGEVLDYCPQCADLEDQIKGLEKDLRAWRARYADATRDREGSMKNHPAFDQALLIFNYWRVRCRHPKSEFTPDRFEMVEPYIRKYGGDMCMMAIDGAAYDPFTTERKNGSKKRHDGWELIFRSADKFEEMVNRAPR